MGVFILLFFYLLVLKSIVRPNKRLLLTVLGGFGLWLVLALRSPYCGMDLVMGAEGSANYYNMFMRSSDSSFVDILRGMLSIYTNMEIGWLLYCKLVSLFSTHFQIFMAVTALLQITLIGYILYKYSKDIVLSYIVFFCFGLYIMCFSSIRQATAFSISFFSFHYLMEKKTWKFILTILVAASLHNSAIIFILAYPIKMVEFTRKKTVWIIAGVFLMLPLLSSFINTVIPIIFGGRYMNFQDKGGAITLFLLYVIICLFALKIKIKNGYDNILRGLILMAAACQSLGFVGTGAITRIGCYFTIFFTLLFPELINAYAAKKERIVAFFVISSLFFFYFYWVNIGGYLNVIPYYFYWEKFFLYY